MTRDIKHELICLLAICISSLEKNVYSGPLLTFLIRFSILNCMDSLSILDISPLFNISFANISHSVGYLFISSSVQKFFLLCCSLICLIFGLVTLALGDRSKKNYC